jgi:Arm DNA-binding domain
LPIHANVHFNCLVHRREHDQSSIDQNRAPIFCAGGQKPARIVPEDREFLWDDALAGFGVGAFLSGKKVYVTQYRQAGRSRRITIGEHGRLTPEEARTEAKKLLGAVAKGGDPIARRQAAGAIPLFGVHAHAR